MGETRNFSRKMAGRGITCGLISMMTGHAAILRLFRLLAFVWLVGGCAHAVAAVGVGEPAEAYPRPLDSYGDAGLGVGGQLWARAQEEPFNVLATALFLCAIVHTFLAPRFMALSHRHQRAYEKLGEAEGDAAERAAHDRLRDQLRFRGQVLHFMGEIEAVFGIWAVPLGVALVVCKGWPVMVDYFAHVSYAEPVFVVVVMAIAASRPGVAAGGSVPRPGGGAGWEQSRGLVAFDSDGGAAAGLFHYRTGGDDDLRVAALPPFLRVEARCRGCATPRWGCCS